MIKYGFTKQFNTDFDTAIEAVKRQLENEGFDVLTTVNVQEKFKHKLGGNFPQYTILGACNPGMAHKAIQAETHIGLMLPCNVIVFEKDEAIVVSAIRPTVAMQMIDNSDLSAVAVTVEQALYRAVESLSMTEVMTSPID